MTDLLSRWKDPSDYTPDEALRSIQAERRGETFRVQTSEYVAARAEALRQAGLVEEADEIENSSSGLDAIEAMTPADHFAAMRADR